MKNEQTFQLPSIQEKEIKLLETLSNAISVSSDEKAVRKIVADEIKNKVDSFSIDALGNLIAIKKAKTEHPVRLMIAAHMDEVGFMLVDKEDDGIFKFRPVGGIDPRMLAGKAVLVGNAHYPGVIGACPIHLTTAKDREQTLTFDDLRIDTGPGTKEINPGDFAGFATQFQQMGSSVCGKALDNRLGVATLILLLSQVPDQVELTAAFTVQEEVGVRGARVAAFDRDFDMAFVIDSTPANDLPSWDGSENTAYKSRLGFGPAIYTADGLTINDPRLIRYFVQTAEAYGIPYQLRLPAGGGTDAGAIHRRKGGIPAVSISIPGRYPHSSAGIARISDWESHYRLLTATMRDLSTSIIEEVRK